MTSQPLEFLEYVIKSLVSHPADVRIDRTVDEMGVLMTLHCHPDDMGKIIGRNGVTAKSIRTLLRVVGTNASERVNMKIMEPEGGSRQQGEVSFARVDTGPRPEASDADAALEALKGEF